MKDDEIKANVQHAKERLDIPSVQLNRLALILGDAMRDKAATCPEGFFEGYLTCCKAISAIANEQEKRERGRS